MSKAPAFQLYAADFYMDTIGWSCEEVGAYFRLLLYEWINGPLPNDPKKLYTICVGRPDHNWKRRWEQLSLNFLSKFSQISLKKLSHLSQYDPSLLINFRLEMEREKQLNKSESQRNNINKRWEKTDTTVLPSNKVGNTLHSSSSIISTNVDMSPNGNCPHQTLINLFHEKLPMLPRVRVWTDARKKTLSTRWKENEAQHTLEWWEGFFEHIAKSKFLTGRTQDKHGKPFLATLAWIIKAENFAKIIEGNYDD